MQVAVTAAARGGCEPRHVPSALGTDISTPDRRVRVFVSSTLRELATERRAARSAITRLHLTPVMFEVGARAHPARELYRAYLAQSDVFVGIYWQSYGWVAPSETVSGLEDEYELSGDRPKLIYVKAGDERDPRLESMLGRIRADDRVSYKQFDATEDLAELLAEDLAVLLTERFTQPPAAGRPSRGTAPVPRAPTPIVGRDAETTMVAALLRDPTVQLVTLTGPGGIGKTRLALEVARGLESDEESPFDGVSFIDLAGVRSASEWPDAVTATLGIRQEGTVPVLDLLIDRLRGQRRLLVLDNVEQIVSAAADLGVLLAACPGLSVLVTSRIVLQLRGEREVSLAPLATPPADDPVTPADVVAIGRSAAVQLLLARARQVRPGFALTAGNAHVVAELSRRLDGIPLALELAAAQLRLLTPAGLLRRLGDRLDGSLDLASGTVDAPDRQRTLRTTIAWSYGLLGEAERALLARLSVFTGAWTMDAADAVGTLDGDVDPVQTLGSLVSQSLIRTEDSDPVELRFRMLDTIRAYARERLLERGEVDATVARLAHYMSGVVEAVRDGLQGPDHRAASERLDRERDEIRSAIDWALTADDAETVGRLITPLFTYWWSKGLLQMTYEVTEKAAVLPSAATLSPYPSALLLGARGMAMVWTGRFGDAEQLLRRTVATATELGNHRLRAYALLGLGWSVVLGDADEASRLLDQAAAGFRGTGDQWGFALTMSTRGMLALDAGAASQARRMHLDALAAAEVIDNDYLKALILDLLGLDATAIGDVAEARDRHVAAAVLHLRLLDYEGSAYGLSGFAGLALAQHRPDAAARLIGAAAAARRIVGIAHWTGMKSMDAARNATTATDLGPAAYAAAREAGAQMHLSDALTFALAATAPDANSGTESVARNHDVDPRPV